MRVVSAPSPEENARQCLAPSSAARHSSSALRVGLPVREYSNPLCLPTPCWAKVVAMWIGCTTAPVAGSGPCPTCKARVENPQSRGEPNSSPFMGRWPEVPEGLDGPASRPPPVSDELEQIRPRDHRHRLSPIH